MCQGGLFNWLNLTENGKREKKNETGFLCFPEVRIVPDWKKENRWWGDKKRTEYQREREKWPKIGYFLSFFIFIFIYPELFLPWASLQKAAQAHAPWLDIGVPCLSWLAFGITLRLKLIRRFFQHLACLTWGVLILKLIITGVRLHTLDPFATRRRGASKGIG